MNQNEQDTSHIPSKEELEAIAAREQLAHKERAITAGLVVELEPDEADALGIAGMDVLPPGDEKLEQDLLDSRFDECEFDLTNYKLNGKGD